MSSHLPKNNPTIIFPIHASGGISVRACKPIRWLEHYLMEGLG